MLFEGGWNSKGKAVLSRVNRAPSNRCHHPNTSIICSNMIDLNIKRMLDGITRLTGSKNYKGSMSVRWQVY